MAQAQLSPEEARHQKRMLALRTKAAVARLLDLQKAATWHFLAQNFLVTDFDMYANSFHVVGKAVPARFYI